MRACIRKLSVFLITGVLVACGKEVADGPMLDPSAKDLKLLLATPWEDLSGADVDRLEMLTGTMSPAEYATKYNVESAESELGGIVDLVWGSWEKVDIPGAVCGNGTPYKIFVMRSTGFLNWLLGNTRRLLIYLEPGGACWDYPTCTGQAGVRGAANPNGIPDNHMSLVDFINPDVEGGSVSAAISPLILRNNPTGDNVATSQWNKVFIPYCTGDGHTGNSVVTYEDPTGENEPITYHHVGARNIEKVIDYLVEEFDQPREMMVAGCSAGGVGTLANYHFFRQTLNPSTSHMLNDSGPLFPAPGTGNHFPLQEHIRQAWDLDYLVDKISADVPEVPLSNDFGLINEALAQLYPDDRLATTLFKRDGIYSIYSYAQFFDLDENIPEEKEQMLQLWAEDVEGMVAQYDAYDNLSYFIPYMRNVIDSHCTTIIEWTGTEIEDTGIDVGHYINDILDGGQVASYEEPDNPSDADVTDFWFELIDLLR